MDEIKIDIEKLRSDLIDYFGSAMFSGFPMSMMELEKVKDANDEQLIEIAYKNGIDLNMYIESSKIYKRY